MLPVVSGYYLSESEIIYFCLNLILCVIVVCSLAEIEHFL